MVEQNSESDASEAPKVGTSFLVGRDIEGHWWAVEEHGRGGGLFASKEAALRYVGFETGRAPGGCHLVAGLIRPPFGEAPARKAA